MTRGRVQATARGQGARRPVDKVTHAVTSAEYGWTSQNWSGYAVAGDSGAFQAITGNWRVPEVTPTVGGDQAAAHGGWWKRLLVWLSRLLSGNGSQRDAYSATWIGIDGFSDTQLIQIGTAQNVIAGQPQYYAWWEILPSPETVIPPQAYPVRPGDQVTAAITRQEDRRWRLSLWNRTQGWVFARPNLNYDGPLTSAEWIEEAPEVDERLARLADFGEVVFTGCSLNGLAVRLQPADAGAMVQGRQTVAVPSAPAKSGDAFTIAFGSTAPAAPGG
ncbi:G1 family glutamic endopeptidase [Alicyclobacillus kakegawensis]|uniref:G1 family glutamic endopeptidase n=1 Tax=Alicyclobacillus kakegawensis TaxID=392012 RepID=UPI00083574CF|nr:G1 family glutamic endopeptidase [Alicyclobacillus kakegawensis]